MNSLLVVLAFFFVPQRQSVDITQMQYLMDVSCLIRAKVTVSTPEGPKKGLIGCSGTYIGPDTVLTAAHCFEIKPTAIWVRGPSSDGSHRAHIVKIQFPKDLALLHIDGPEHLYVKLALTNPHKGDKIVNVGSPRSFEFLLSEGIVAGLRQKVKEMGLSGTHIITTAMINPGSSGGGAFNDKGELVGVNNLSMGLFGWTGISLAVDLDTIKAFLGGF